MSMEPATWRITCSAWDCNPDRWAPKTKPLIVTGTRAEATRAAKAKGWRPISEVSHGRGTKDWWCPIHVHSATAARAAG